MLELLNDRQRLWHLFLEGADVPEYVVDRPTWMLDAACHDQTAVFFPELGQDATAAKAICATCPVLGTCLAYAVAEPSLKGVWGGTSEVERKRLRRSAA